MEWTALLERFPGRKIVVVGDLVVDCVVETRPARLSREAPVPVLHYERRRFLPGCAANTAMNLRALGAEVLVAGVLGEDEAGAATLDAFRDVGVDTSGVVQAGRSIVKVRIVCGEASRTLQQVLRVDYEPTEPPSMEVLQAVQAGASKAGGAEGLIVSDYGYGGAPAEVVQAFRAASPDALVSVDARNGVCALQGVDLFTPNEEEAALALGRPIRNDEDACAAARELRAVTGAAAVLLTRGNRGMAVCDGDVTLLPIFGSHEIVDPTGAGDTVVASAALARAAGAGPVEAARLAGFAAGVVVMKAGAASVSRTELLEAIRRG